MFIKRLLSTGILTFAFMFSTGPARAGIPVIDATSIAQQIQQVVAWAQQYTQMVDQLNQLQAQFNQLQTMTGKLDGSRALGTILNDPTIQSQLPPELRNAAAMLLNPAALSSSTASINSILSSFGVSGVIDPAAGRSIADSYGRAQSILASAQQRSTQLQALAARVDNAADAKESLDLLNRNTLESANINNQMVQTMAALEAARQAEELRRVARSQAFSAAASTGARAPVINYSY
jgi:type IV secretion system protein VirB5